MFTEHDEQLLIAAAYLLGAHDAFLQATEYAGGKVLRIAGAEKPSSLQSVLVQQANWMQETADDLTTKELQKLVRDTIDPGWSGEPIDRATATDAEKREG